MTIRLGRIGYRNVLPIYRALEDGRLKHGMELVYGPPAALNDRMAAGELDVASVSSIEYARRPQRYLLLPGLCIGSRGPVRSVLLLSRSPVDELHGRSILVSAQTHTSAALLRVLLAEHLRVTCACATGDATAALAAGQRPEAILAIGDEALRLRRHPEYPFRLDLGAAWSQWSGLPFVFGVWVASRESAAEKPGEVAEAVAMLHRSKALGMAELGAISMLAAPESGLNVSEMRDYFNGLVFDLGDEECRGLTRFYDELQRFGMLPGPVPVRFFDADAPQNARTCP